MQHLDFLSSDEKDVFKTAFEIDQRWLIELAADRTKFICQSQSLNLFLPADIHKRDLHGIHFSAWKKGVKSLYYCRSKSLQRADTIATLGETGVSSASVGADLSGSAVDYDECLACQ